MKHRKSTSFNACLKKLPFDVQQLAFKNFQLLKADPSHPSLQLKKVGKFWSVRIGLHYRALAIPIDNGLLWVWIGIHTEYDKLLFR